MELRVGQLRRWIVLKRTMEGVLQEEVPFVITSIRNIETPSGSYTKLVDFLSGGKIAESFSYEYITKNSEIIE